VDEVLALGDAEFQKRCLGKMHDVSKGGRTVLFVSHNMSTIMTLCNRAILLDHGVLRLDSSATEAVQNYLRQYTGLESFERGIGQADKLKIVSGRFALTTETNRFLQSVELTVWSDADRKVSLDLRVSEGTGVPVGFGSLGTFTSADLVEIRRGVTTIVVSFPTEFLANGTYALSFDVTIPFREYFDRAERCLSFGLERSAPIGQSHVATQNWGYGSLEIPVYLDQLTRVSN
jgi:lipopolysaccharide transport system ATP-binding protein